MIEADLAQVLATIGRLEAKVDMVATELCRLRRADGPVLKRMSEVVREYHYPESTLRLHIKQGLIHATKRGRVVLIDVSQLAPVPDDEIAAMAARARAR